MKKILAAVLTIALLAGISAGMAAFAASDPYIKIQDIPDNISLYEVGGTYDVRVGLSQTIAGLTSYQLAINFNPAFVSVEEVEANITSGTEGINKIDNETGTILFAYYKGEEDLEDNVLANIKLKVLQEGYFTSKDGDNTITVDTKGTRLLKKAVDETTVVVIPYQVDTATPYELGHPPKAPSISSENGNTRIVPGINDYISLTSNAGSAPMYYTTNGTTPTMSSNLYTGEFKLSAAKTVKAVAFKRGLYSEPPASVAFTFGGSTGGSTGGGGGGGPTYPVFTPAPTAQPARYADINGHWAYEYMMELIGTGVINGYEDGQVRPNNPITREEATKMMTAATGLQSAPSLNLTFADTDSIAAWAKGYVQAAVTAGFVTGYEDNTFLPKQNISRKEFAVMTMKAFGYGQKEGATLTFGDKASIPSWASGYIAQAIDMGVITGYEDNTFLPDKLVTRAEASAMIAKAKRKAQ